jgi:hypothetical protein
MAKNEEQSMRTLATVLLSAALAGIPLSLRAQQFDGYAACSFYPQGAGCDQVYRQALKDNSPSALPVRGAFQDYARYLKMPASGLSAEDRRWLQDNGIRLPALNPSNQAGLHNLLHDQALQDGDKKRAAVNNFLGRAVQAELYCSFNSCDPPAPATS